MERLHRRIRESSRDEEWATIPWITDLWEARAAAAREQKPILMWNMNGSPLGCT
jgi:hypothetical protein